MSHVINVENSSAAAISFSVAKSLAKNEFMVFSCKKSGDEIFQLPFFPALSSFPSIIVDESAKNGYELSVPFFCFVKSKSLAWIASDASIAMRTQIKLVERDEKWQDRVDALIWTFIAANKPLEAIDFLFGLQSIQYERYALLIVAFASPKCLQIELFLKLTRHLLITPLLSSNYFEEVIHLVFLFFSTAPKYFYLSSL